MSFKTSTVYRLKDPEHFDDEDHGVGFDHIETYGECDGMFITDCWVVNAEGEVHPGYESSPVPVRFDDVEAETDLPAVNSDKERSGLSWG